MVVLFWRWKNSESGSRTLDLVGIASPGIGRHLAQIRWRSSVRMLGTLLSGGLPLVPSLETAGASIQSRSVADSVLEASQKVREGRPLSRSLEEGEVPELAVEMIEVGDDGRIAGHAQLCSGVLRRRRPECSYGGDVTDRASASDCNGRDCRLRFAFSILPIFTSGTSGIH